MNKAFTKEPEQDGELRCPRCESLSRPVEHETLAAHVRAESLKLIAESGYFCPFPDCDVAYFDQFGRTLLTDALTLPVYPKDRTAPICACFGLIRDDIEADLADGTPTRCRELIAKSKTAAARCSVLAADGQCCVPEVQRYFMKLKQAAAE